MSLIRDINEDLECDWFKAEINVLSKMTFKRWNFTYDISLKSLFLQACNGKTVLLNFMLCLQSGILLGM